MLPVVSIVFLPTSFPVSPATRQGARNASRRWRSGRTVPWSSRTRSSQDKAKLFQTTIQNINLHLWNIHEGGDPGATIKPCLIIRSEGTRQIRSAVASEPINPTRAPTKNRSA